MHVIAFLLTVVGVALSLVYSDVFAMIAARCSSSAAMFCLHFVMKASIVFSFFGVHYNERFSICKHENKNKPFFFQHTRKCGLF